MSTRKPRAGRRQSVERIRELVSLLGSLSHVGDTVTLDAIASRLGIGIDEAASMMDIVCQASGEEMGGLLVSANEQFTEFTLEYPDIHGMPLRLTQSETIALVHALDVTGIPKDDPIRSRVLRAYSSPGIDDDEVRKTLGASRTPELGDTLKICAHARAASRMVDFLYCGLADNAPRERCALIRNLRLEHDRWYVDAYDLDVLEERVFRLDRMRSATLGPRGRLPEKDTASSAARLVQVTFSDPSYVTLFDWPGLRITQTTPDCVEGTLPYYEHGGDWLLRRIAACGGTLQVHDEDIMLKAREYARNALSDCAAAAE